MDANARLAAALKTYDNCIARNYPRGDALACALTLNPHVSRTELSNAINAREAN